MTKQRRLIMLMFLINLLFISNNGNDVFKVWFSVCLSVSLLLVECASLVIAMRSSRGSPCRRGLEYVDCIPLQWDKNPTHPRKAILVMTRNYI